MRRSERHHALLDVLRADAERPVPVPRLAERFAVSTRTIERDLAALQAAGVPIYAESGRRGGYAIRRDYSLPPLAFTLAEATAVSAGLSVMMGSPLRRGGAAGLGQGARVDAARASPAGTGPRGPGRRTGP